MGSGSSFSATQGSEGVNEATRGRGQGGCWELPLETHTHCASWRWRWPSPRLTSPERGDRGAGPALFTSRRSQQPWACQTSPRRWLLGLHDFLQWKQLGEGIQCRMAPLVLGSGYLPIRDLNPQEQPWQNTSTAANGMEHLKPRVRFPAALTWKDVDLGET